MPPNNRLTADGVHFNPTQWSIVLAAQKKGGENAEQALEQLCRDYWSPLYVFIRRQGETPHDAEDLTQAFFAKLLEKDYLEGVDQSKGRFRSFLLASLKHFLSHEREKARAQKRGGGQTMVPIDVQSAETHYGVATVEPAEPKTAEKMFERRWALALLELTMVRLREDYASQGKIALFEQLKITLTEPRGTIGYVALGNALGLSEAAVKMAVLRLRRRYREILRAEVAQTVAEPEDVEDEIRHIIQSLSG
jgi:DNA-directed RNA polymerase specialized sigma24 family protein